MLFLIFSTILWVWYYYCHLVDKKIGLLFRSHWLKSQSHWLKSLSLWLKLTELQSARTMVSAQDYVNIRSPTLSRLLKFCSKAGPGRRITSVQCLFLCFWQYVQDYFIFYFELCFPAIKGLITGCFPASKVYWAESQTLPCLLSLFIICSWITGSLLAGYLLCILNDPFKTFWRVLEERWGETF